MRIGRWISRLTRISAALLLGLAFVATTAVVGVGAAAAPPALAATSGNARGPSAASDEYNNQYVFWRGATGNNNLWEAYYNVYTGQWNGPLNLGMGPLGSEPTVAVSNQVFAGPGGEPFNAQYVYWQGTNGDLYLAYWEGKWYGPVNLGGVAQDMCSQPGAAALATEDGLKIVIFWQGIGDSGSGDACTNDTSSTEMWYAFSTTDNPTADSDYLGPNLDSYAGIIGSSPSVTSTTEECNIAGFNTCNDLAVIAWQGTDGGLWSEQWNVVSGNVTGPTEDTYAGGLGSPPSASGYVTNTQMDAYDLVWQGSGADHYLWIGHYTNGSYTPVSDLTISGTLGSAPTISDSPDGNSYVYWIGSGSAHDLWLAEWNGSWTVTNLGMGPLA